MGNGDLTLTLCALQIENRWIAFRILQFIRSSLYNRLITVLIFVHVLSALQLPETPDVLRDKGFESTAEKTAVAVIFILILIELIDLILHGVSRFILFGVVKHEYLQSLVKLRYGFEHKFVAQIDEKSPLWLTFFGLSHWRLFQIHIATVTIIIFNTIFMVSPLHIAPFEYWLPAVPFLLAVRSAD